MNEIIEKLEAKNIDIEEKIINFAITNLNIWKTILYQRESIVQ